MPDVRHNAHMQGSRNELRGWSFEKLAAQPVGAQLFAGRFWQLATTGAIFYSPDGIAIVQIAPAAAGAGVAVVTASFVVPDGIGKVICNNNATAIVITLPAANSVNRRSIVVSRGRPSTGAITVRGTTGQIQALSGLTGATTTLPAHSAAGAGFNHTFTSDGFNWYR